METKLLNASQLDVAAHIIKNGGVVAMPTETVYGLAANALNGAAVEKIFAAKGRPADNPLIVHISEPSQLDSLVSEVPQKARMLSDAFWPGPLTIILPRSDVIPQQVSAGLDTVAVRCPSHPIARELIRLSYPLAAPSANLSGSPSPTTVQHVIDDMNGRIDAIIDGGDCAVGVESTVITLAGDVPRLLRPGGITHEQLEAVIGTVEVDKAVVNPLPEGAQAASPGMKYKHYSPKADVILINGTEQQFIDYVNSHSADGTAALCCSEDVGALRVPYEVLGDIDDMSEHARKLFSALRKADERGWRTVYARCPEKSGVGLAVYNRMVRAAGFEIIEL